MNYSFSPLNIRVVALYDIVQRLSTYWLIEWFLVSLLVHSLIDSLIVT